VNVRGWAEALQRTSHLDGLKTWEKFVKRIAADARAETVRHRCVGIYRNTADGGAFQCELLAPHEGKCRPVEPLQEEAKP
jgi:hypothetical protein